VVVVEGEGSGRGERIEQWSWWRERAVVAKEREGSGRARGGGSEQWS